MSTSVSQIVRSSSAELCSARAKRHRYTVLGEKLQRAEAALGEKGDKLVVRIAGALESVGTFLGEYGCAAVICGKIEALPVGVGVWSRLSVRWAQPKLDPEGSAGWHLLQRSLLNGYWAERFLRAPSLFPSGDPPAMSRRALMLCHAIATGQDDLARWLGADLRRWRGELPDDDPLEWRAERVENFALWLHAKWLGDSYHAWKDLGAYRGIVDAWDAGGEQLSQAISAVCDWRMEHTDVPDPENCMFEWGYDFFPYKLFPAEFLAVERIRRERGLDVVRPDHPLLQTPLANPPYPLPMPQDELVDRVIAAVRKQYPTL